MAKAALAAQVVVTLKHLAAEVADKHDLPKKQAEAILGEVVASIGKQLKKGSKIRIVGLGILQVRKRAARMGRNPQTGEAIKIKASKKDRLPRREGSERIDLERSLRSALCPGQVSPGALALFLIYSKRTRCIRRTLA